MHNVHIFSLSLCLNIGIIPLQSKVYEELLCQLYCTLLHVIFQLGSWHPYLFRFSKYDTLSTSLSPAVIDLGFKYKCSSLKMGKTVHQSLLHWSKEKKRKSEISNKCISLKTRLQSGRRQEDVLKYGWTCSYHFLQKTTKYCYYLTKAHI